jgi:hypothetical protein
VVIPSCAVRPFHAVDITEGHKTDRYHVMPILLAEGAGLPSPSWRTSTRRCTRS